MADKDFKPEPVSSAALIPVGGTNFYNMQSVEQLQSMEASAPAFHRSVTRALVASGKVREENIQPEQLRGMDKTERAQRHGRNMSFGTGARVMINETGKKVTIIQASAGHTKKTKVPVHKVADTKGNVWLEKETALTLLL